MIFLYIKQHSITGLKYFGKTTKNPYTYYGSGKYWKNHINKYGKEHIITLETFEFNDQKEATAFALQFSEYNCIVESKLWANQIPENATNYGLELKGKDHPNFGKPGNNKSKTWKHSSIQNSAKSLRQRGNPQTEESILKRIESRRNNKGWNGRTGYICSEEEKELLSIKAKNRTKIECPHCRKIGPGPQMKRWHFNNCKEILKCA